MLTKQDQNTRKECRYFVTSCHSMTDYVGYPSHDLRLGNRARFVRLLSVILPDLATDHLSQSQLYKIANAIIANGALDHPGHTNQ